eukprot:TRINITY_DN2360_c0_g1_i1.p1 TRINITY_DN2360_c0_g1~~TRINITY_DN2360_c0_g1_i1.p1  ORF type:complete len:425 (+),score=136.76 TRINITY_DN2360_c0_g1_i1:49-1323(+)
MLKSREEHARIIQEKTGMDMDTYQKEQILKVGAINSTIGFNTLIPWHNDSILNLKRNITQKRAIQRESVFLSESKKWSEEEKMKLYQNLPKSCYKFGMGVEELVKGVGSKNALQIGQYVWNMQFLIKAGDCVVSQEEIPGARFTRHTGDEKTAKLSKDELEVFVSKDKDVDVSCVKATGRKKVPGMSLFEMNAHLENFVREVMKLSVFLTVQKGKNTDKKKRTVVMKEEVDLAVMLIRKDNPRKKKSKKRRRRKTKSDTEIDVEGGADVSLLELPVPDNLEDVVPELPVPNFPVSESIFPLEPGVSDTPEDLSESIFSLEPGVSDTPSEFSKPTFSLEAAVTDTPDEISEPIFSLEPTVTDTPDELSESISSDAMDTDKIAEESSEISSLETGVKGTIPEEDTTDTASEPTEENTNIRDESSEI